MLAGWTASGRIHLHGCSQCPYCRVPIGMSALCCLRLRGDCQCTYRERGACLMTSHDGRRTPLAHWHPLTCARCRSSSGFFGQQSEIWTALSASEDWLITLCRCSDRVLLASKQLWKQCGAACFCSLSWYLPLNSPCQPFYERAGLFRIQKHLLPAISCIHYMLKCQSKSITTSCFSDQGFNHVCHLAAWQRCSTLNSITNQNSGTARR